jgi:hypothetical protein
VSRIAGAFGDPVVEAVGIGLEEDDELLGPGVQ